MPGNGDFRRFFLPVFSNYRSMGVDGSRPGTGLTGIFPRAAAELPRGRFPICSTFSLIASWPAARTQNSRRGRSEQIAAERKSSPPAGGNTHCLFAGTRVCKDRSRVCVDRASSRCTGPWPTPSADFPKSRPLSSVPESNGRNSGPRGGGSPFGNRYEEADDGDHQRRKLSNQ